jgi:hypothetical protein
LRDSVNTCFKAFIPYVDSECLGLLTDVLVRDNNEFIDDMDEKEMVDIADGIEQEEETEQQQ